MYHYDILQVEETETQGDVINVPIWPLVLQRTKPLFLASQYSILPVKSMGLREAICPEID